MTVRVPTDRIPSLCGTTTGQRQLVQAVGGDMSVPASSATMSPYIAAPRIPFAAPEISSVGGRAGRMSSRKEASLAVSMLKQGDGQWREVRERHPSPLSLSGRAQRRRGDRLLAVGDPRRYRWASPDGDGNK